MTYRKDWGQPQAGQIGAIDTSKTIGRVVTLAAADLVTGNTVGAFKVPAGFCVTGIIAVPTDMDSGAALTISVGDAARRNALPKRFHHGPGGNYCYDTGGRTSVPQYR